MSALRHERESRSRCPRRTLHIFDQSAEAIAFRITDAHGSIEHLLGSLNHAVEQRAASCEHDAARQLTIPTCIANFIRDVHQNFFGAWLQDVAKNLTREFPRRATSDRWNLDHL